MERVRVVAVVALDRETVAMVDGDAVEDHAEIGVVVGDEIAGIVVAAAPEEDDITVVDGRCHRVALHQHVAEVAADRGRGEDEPEEQRGAEQCAGKDCALDRTPFKSRRWQLGEVAVPQHPPTAPQ